jgi:phage terminase large subunit-like protein
MTDVKLGNISPELLRQAAERYKRLALIDCFDPNDLKARPTAAQSTLFQEFGTIRKQWIVSANQCLAKGTLVATPSGPVAIEDIKVGDTVYNEHGQPIKVLKTFINGTKQLYSLRSRGVEWAKATADHVWLTNVVDGPNKSMGQQQLKTSELTKYSKVRRVFVKAPLGNVSIPAAYTLGVCLGDGCSRQAGRLLQISSGTEPVIAKVAGDLSATYVKAHVSNHTWKIKTDLNQIPYYNDWCKGRYAHEKLIDLELIKNWDRNSCLNLLAGLFDTDGSLSGNTKAKTVRWSIGMQAKSVVDAVEYLLLALWQVKATRQLDARSKYKNGPLHIAAVTSPYEIKRIMEELQPLLVSEQKYWKDQYNDYGKRSSPDQIYLTTHKDTIEETYDIHVDSPTNLYLLANGLVTHNSGKSQSCSRLTAWVFSETHPYWKRPAVWNKEPLLILVCGRTGKQLEDSIVPRICAYLPPEDYKLVRIGNIAQRLEHVNGNKIVFQSLENPNIAAERVQSYVAHLVWVDEMPSTSKIIDELITRTNSKDGYFLASFTPLVHNPDIRKMVDSAKLPDAKKYQFKMFDNPLYADPEKQKSVLAAYSHLSETALNCRLYGDWMEAEQSVWHIDRDRMVVAPPNYHPSWRHVEASDPAVSSKFGLTIWAEDPSTGIWYCIRDDYLEGIAAPDDIVAEVRRRTDAINLMRRICDPHESWYLGQAAKAGMSYLCPKKDGRKEEMIKNLQHALSSGKIRIAPWCTRLVNELEGATWAETTTGKNKIVGASKLHLCDTAQYFVDLMPPPTKELAALPWHEQLRRADAQIKAAKVERAKAQIGRKKKWTIR